MVWLPPLIIIGVFVARLIELRHPFPAAPGKVEARYTLPTLTIVGSLTVIAGVIEYVTQWPTPNWILMSTGLLLACSAFALRAAARRALGAMWSIHIEIRDNHSLVSSGPYQYIRHPIYVAALAEVAAIPITLGTWRAGLFCVSAYLIALAVRVQTEERAMAAQLGRKWTDYCKTTGAFVPKW